MLDKLLDRFEHRVTIDSILRSKSPTTTNSDSAPSGANSSATLTVKGAEISHSPQPPMVSKSNGKRTASKPSEKGHSEVKTKGQEFKEGTVEKGTPSKRVSESGKGSLQGQVKPHPQTEASGRVADSALDESGITSIGTATKRGASHAGVGGGGSSRDKDSNGSSVKGKVKEHHGSKGSGLHPPGKDIPTKEHQQQQKKKLPVFNKAPRFTRNDDSDAAVVAGNESRSKSEHRGAAVQPRNFRSVAMSTVSKHTAITKDTVAMDTRRADNAGVIGDRAKTQMTKEGSKQQKGDNREGAKVEGCVASDKDLTQDQWDSSEEIDLLGDSDMEMEEEVEKEEVGKEEVRKEEEEENSGGGPELNAHTTPVGVASEGVGRNPSVVPLNVNADGARFGGGKLQAAIAAAAGNSWHKPVTMPLSTPADIWAPHLPFQTTPTPILSEKRGLKISRALQQAIDSAPLQKYAVEGEMDERNCSLLNQHLLVSELVEEHQKMHTLSKKLASSNQHHTDDFVSLVGMLKRSKVDCFQEYLSDALMEKFFGNRFSVPSLRSLIEKSADSASPGSGGPLLEGKNAAMSQKWNAMSQPSQLLKITGGRGFPLPQAESMEPRNARAGGLEPNVGTGKGAALETENAESTDSEDPAILQKVVAGKTKPSLSGKSVKESLSAIFGGGRHLGAVEDPKASRDPLSEDPCILKVTSSLSSDTKLTSTAVEEPLSNTSYLTSAYTAENPLPNSSDMPSVFPSALDGNEANLLSAFSTSSFGSGLGDQALPSKHISAVSANQDTTEWPSMDEMASRDPASKSCDPKMLSVHELEQLMTNDEAASLPSDSSYSVSQFQSSKANSSNHVSQFHSSKADSSNSVSQLQSKGDDRVLSSSSLPTFEKWACPTTPTSMEAWSPGSHSSSITGMSPTTSKTNHTHTPGTTVSMATVTTPTKSQQGATPSLDPLQGGFLTAPTNGTTAALAAVTTPTRIPPSLDFQQCDSVTAPTNETDWSMPPDGMSAEYPTVTDMIFLMQCFPDLEEAYLCQLLARSDGNMEDTVSMALLSSTMSAPITPLSGHTFFGRAYETQTSGGSTISSLLTQDDLSAKSAENLIYESDENSDVGSHDQEGKSCDHQLNEDEKSHGLSQRSHDRSHNQDNAIADVVNDEEIARALQERLDEESVLKLGGTAVAQSEHDEQIARALQEVLNEGDGSGGAGVTGGALHLENGPLEHVVEESEDGGSYLEKEEAARWSDNVDEEENLLLRLTPSLAQQLQNLFGSVQEHLPLNGIYVCVCMYLRMYF